VCSVCSCPFHFAVSGGFDFALGCAVRNAYEARVFCLGRGTSSPCFGCPGFGRPAPVCSGLHSSPSVPQESSRFFWWLRFCAEASLRVDFLVSHLARVVLIFYREFRFPSFGCRCQEHCERPPIHGPRFSVRSIFSTGAGVRFCCVLRFPLREERAQKYLCRPVPLKRFRIGLSSPLPISISRLVSSLRARRPDLSRYRCGYWLPRLARRSSLSASSVFGLASAVPSPDFAEFVLPPAAVDR
jgi:hypothetical protein